MVLFEAINKNVEEYGEFHIALTLLSNISLILARILDILKDAEASRFNENIYIEFKSRQNRITFSQLIEECYDALVYFVGEIDKTMIRI